MGIIFTIVFVVLFFYILVWNKKKRAAKIAQQAKNKIDAQALNMHVNSSLGQNNSSSDSYSGTTGDIPWTLESKEIIINRGSSGSDWKRTTRWSTTAIKMQSGRFLMIMSTPNLDNSKTAIKKGFFGAIVNRVAEFALDFYVKNYFGDQYTSLVNVAGATKIDIPNLKNLFILTNDDTLSKKFLNDLAVKFIANWMNNKIHFAHDTSVSTWGALFCEDGIIISCQANMVNAEEAKVFSDFGASLATLMKEASLQPG